jgi:hypothetical protein
MTPARLTVAGALNEAGIKAATEAIRDNNANTLIVFSFFKKKLDLI